MLPLLPIAISLATKFAPLLLGKLFGNKAEETAEKVVGIANGALGGGLAPEKLAQAMADNWDAQVAFTKAANDLTSELYQEDTKRLEAVNSTMQSETLSESWMQRSWRPWNGFAFSLVLFCDYFAAQIVLALSDLQIEWSHIPFQVYMLWTAVLGVTAGSRGVEKIANLQGPGIVGVIKNALK